MRKITLLNLRRAFYLENQQSLICLDFIENNIDFSVFYDRNSGTLTFLKKLTSLELDVKIDDYFNIDTLLPLNDLILLKKMLELKNDSRVPFSTITFFQTFDENFSIKTETNPEIRKYIASKHHLENPDAIYYLGKQDHRGKNNGHVRQTNKDKVKEFLPKLYEHIKDLDISIMFTPEQYDERKKHEKDIISDVINDL